VTGPAVGEALAQRSQWRWIFWINLPFSLTAFGILCVFASLKARAPGSMLAQLRNYDWIGFGLLSGSMMSILVGISWVSQLRTLLKSIQFSLARVVGLSVPCNVVCHTRLDDFVRFRRTTLTAELGRYCVQVEPSQHAAAASVWTARAHHLSDLVMVCASRLYSQLGRAHGPHDSFDVHWPYDPRRDHIVRRVLHGKSESICDVL
jgi:MFS family permease